MHICKKHNGCQPPNAGKQTPDVSHRKKHMACCKKYKPYILKYKALISKYMPYIFSEKSHLIFNNLQKHKNYREIPQKYGLATTSN